MEEQPLCSICKHQKCLAINAALVASVPLSVIAGRFHVKRELLGFHIAHVPGLSPCGEVIWDLSTCLWDFIPTTLEPGTLRMGYAPLSPLPFETRLTHIMRRLERNLETRPDTGGPDNPLPPLDTLDEGCQCCGQDFATFAEYMAHVRTHGIE